MSNKALEKLQCSTAQTLNLVGDAWSFMILRDTMYGYKRFSQFQKHLGISKNILSQRLNKLVEQGILLKQETTAEGRYEYLLSQKGEELLPVLIALMQWGDKWVQGNHGEPVTLIDRKNRAPLQKIAVIASDGRHLNRTDLSFKPGPGADSETLEFLNGLRGLANN